MKVIAPLSGVLCPRPEPTLLTASRRALVKQGRDERLCPACAPARTPRESLASCPGPTSLGTPCGPGGCRGRGDPVRRGSPPLGPAATAGSKRRLGARGRRCPVSFDLEDPGRCAVRGGGKYAGGSLPHSRGQPERSSEGTIFSCSRLQSSSTRFSLTE